MPSREMKKKKNYKLPFFLEVRDGPQEGRMGYKFFFFEGPQEGRVGYKFFFGRSAGGESGIQVFFWKVREGPQEGRMGYKFFFFEGPQEGRVGYKFFFEGPRRSAGGESGIQVFFEGPRRSAGGESGIQVFFGRSAKVRRRGEWDTSFFLKVREGPQEGRVGYKFFFEGPRRSAGGENAIQDFFWKVREGPQEGRMGYKFFL